MEHILVTGKEFDLYEKSLNDTKIGKVTLTDFKKEHLLFRCIPVVKEKIDGTTLLPEDVKITNRFGVPKKEVSFRDYLNTLKDKEYDKNNQ